ncbi:MAG TPA: hypothetical protein VFX59_08390 [Polyangiales bacterium]|nr:hypothetical protein [Polyangiales bacterium]
MKHILLVLFLATACHHAGTLRGERVLERGGELAGVSLEDKKVQLTASTLSAWGVIEVPDGSRMQASYAGADAIARSELLKYVRVRVEDVMVSVDSTDPARRDAYEHTVETVHGTLRRGGITQHAWERVQRGEQRILRVWSRLSVPRADLQSVLPPGTL